MRARCVLDCSGRSGVVARDGWRRASTDARTTAVVGIWERDDGWSHLVPDETHTIVESYAGGWAWSIPVTARRRYVTVMIDPELTRIPGRPQLAAAYASEIGRTDRMSALVRGARLHDEPWARDASPYTAERFGEIGLLLVGDAGSFVDPLSSFGVKKALASAWLASVVANTWLLDASTGLAALDLFNRRERDMYEHLQRQASSLARSAATAYESEFWVERADESAIVEGELDIETLRTDPRVLAAFEELKRRPQVRLRAAAMLRVVSRAVVRGARVVLDDHLAAPAVRGGVRYARSIDLVLLARIAESHDQVPDMFDSYNRRAPAASLPDFLGALSTLIGLEMLTLA
jgi:flavin-dependent dehydrogenase